MLDEIRKFSGARIKYGPLQNDHRLLAISGNNEQIDMAVHILQTGTSFLKIFLILEILIFSKNLKKILNFKNLI